MFVLLSTIAGLYKEYNKQLNLFAFKVCVAAIPFSMFWMFLAICDLPIWYIYLVNLLAVYLLIYVIYLSVTSTWYIWYIYLPGIPPSGSLD
jgi:hypothetical protein